MPKPFHRSLAILLLAGLMLACQPALNWREVAFDQGGLKLMLPCKPDRANRVFPIDKQEFEFIMLGCEADGIHFSVASTHLEDPAQITTVLGLWQAATLASVRSSSSSASAFVQPGAASNANSKRVIGPGRDAENLPIVSQAAYFTKGTRIYRAMILFRKADPEAFEAFFSGLRFQ